MEAVINVFDKYRMPALAIDEYLTKGKDILLEKIKSFVAKNLPLKFVMLGFPMKSMNDRDKVLGDLPDLGEEVAFDNFRNFEADVKQVYAPGVEMQIVSDGYIFNDVLNMPDELVKIYEEMCIEMGKNIVRFYDVQDFYGHNIAAGREKVVKHFGITPEELEQKILFDPNVNILYRGMIKFMTGDLAIRDWPSNSQLHKAAKITAREMMLRNEAYSNLVSKEFSDSIRLSMHQSVNDGRKFSFQLIPSDHVQHSPWHSVLVKTDTGFETMMRAEAEKNKYDLITKENRPYGYWKS